jgi:homoserine dehydrogenase
MKTINLILSGFGNVGKAFVHLVREKKDICLSRYELDIHIGIVLNSRGGLFLSPYKTDRANLSDLASGSNPEELPFWQPGLGVGEILEYPNLDIWVDCTPSDITDGEPALGYVHRALDRGLHVVTANKGPLVVDFNGIRKKAAKNRVSLGMSGATAAALPTLDVALRSLAGTDIRRIEGILNGTTNYILTQMREGKGYAAALEEAQQKGIAEPDPSRDVEGWDTAAKILIIVNAIYNTAYGLGDMRVEGITNIPAPLRDEAREKGQSLKLIGRFVKEAGPPLLEAGLALLDPLHPLFGVNGTQKGITFFTDTMDTVTVTGGKSDPRGAAAALLKDIINIYRS